MFWNGVWVVGVDIGDGDDWVDSTCMGGEVEFDGGRGYDLFDLKGAKPLMIQLLGHAGGHIVLSIQPYLSSDLVDRSRAPPMVIVLCHLICWVFEGGLRFIPHLRHLLGKVISSFYGRTLSGLQAHLWVLASV